MNAPAGDPLAASRPTLRSPLSSLGWLLPLGAAVVLARLLAGPTGAQEGATPTTAEQVGSDREVTLASWCARFDEEAAHLLRNRPSARTAVLNDLIRVATEGPPDRDLSATVGPLLRVIGNDSKLERRLKAIELLQRLDSDDLFTGLLTTASEHLYALVPGTSTKDCTEAQRRA